MTGDSGGRGMAGTRLPTCPTSKHRGRIVRNQNYHIGHKVSFLMPILTPQGTHSDDSLEHFLPNTRDRLDRKSKLWLLSLSVTNGLLIFLICYIWTSLWRIWGPLYCQNRNWGLCFLNTPKFSFWIKADRTGAVTTSFWKRVARTYLRCSKHNETSLHAYWKEYTIFWIISLKKPHSCF